MGLQATHIHTLTIFKFLKNVKAGTDKAFTLSMLSRSIFRRYMNTLTNAEAVREFTMGAGQPAPEFPKVMKHVCMLIILLL